METSDDDELVLVTGATGYLASHVIKQLLERGHRVRGTVRDLGNTKKCEPIRQLVADCKHPIELVEANLTDENAWSASVAGCAYVIHTASPIPSTLPDDENELIVPAVNGVLNVLKAAEEHNVKRVVLTSSITAIMGDTIESGRVYDEQTFADTANTNAYSKSKILAEKAAWDFVRERQENGLPCFELTVINPGYIVGPILTDTYCTSMKLIMELMLGRIPLVPDICLASCDVRDCALVHILAMTLPQAASNRYLVVARYDGESTRDVAQWLKLEFAPKGYSISTRALPNCMFRLVSLFNKTAAFARPFLAKKAKYNVQKVCHAFNLQQMIDPRQSVVEMAYSMIDKGFIPRRFALEEK